MNSSKGLLSVVIPVYNDKVRFRQSLENICSQTYPSLELIVIDDGSTDGSFQVALDFQEKYPFIKFYRRLDNQGTIRSLVEGHKKAQGEFVYYASSNDFVRPGFFASAIRLLQEYPKAAFCSGNVLAKSHFSCKELVCSKFIKEPFISPDDLVKKSTSKGLQFFGQATLFRKERYDATCQLHPELTGFCDLFCYFILAHTDGFVLTHRIECDMDVTGGYSSQGSDKKRRNELFAATLRIINTEKYALVKPLIKKSGILAHLGPRLVPIILKNSNASSFFSVKYLRNLAHILSAKILK